MINQVKYIVSRPAGQPNPRVKKKYSKPKTNTPSNTGTEEDLVKSQSSPSQANVKKKKRAVPSKAQPPSYSSEPNTPPSPSRNRTSATAGRPVPLLGLSLSLMASPGRPDLIRSLVFSLCPKERNGARARGAHTHMGTARGQPVADSQAKPSQAQPRAKKDDTRAHVSTSPGSARVGIGMGKGTRRPGGNRALGRGGRTPTPPGGVRAGVL